MMYYPEIHHRQSIRLKEYDYCRSGAYFVTVCAWKKESILGEIENSEMLLNEYGRIVQEQRNTLPGHFENVTIDEFVVMPNHMHGIITLNSCRGEVSSPPEPNSKTITISIQGVDTPPVRKPALGQVVAYLKYQSAKKINIIRDTPGMPLWQRNYYEHIIRDERELHTIREYIRYNPLKWEEDDENPDSNSSG
ncbi:MAG: hypothetical protein HZA15_16845 [Nitrospirae bacterium]|nr:hypothetical protein [Nitrospirota bacterium]